MYSFDPPRQFTKRFVGIKFSIESIAGVIDVIFHFSGDRAPSKAFKCVEREMLLDNDKQRMNRHVTPSYTPCHGTRMG